MMVFPISVKKITTLFNPFEYTDKDITTPITIEEVQLAIKKNKFLTTEPKEYNRAAHINRIAHFYNTNDTSPIVINIGEPEKNNIPLCLIEKGFHKLAAAIIKQDEKILTQLHGSENALESIFSINIKQEKNNLFMWEINESSLKKTWENPDFVYDMIESQKQQVTLLAHQSVWNKDFLNRLLKNTNNSDRHIKFLIEDAQQFNFDLLLKEEFIEGLSHSYFSIIKQWQYIKPLYDKNDIDYNSIRYKGKKSEIKELFNKYVFDKKDTVLNLIEQEQDFYKYLSKKMKLDPDVLKLIYNNNLHKESFHKFNLSDNVPQEYFLNIVNIPNFLGVFYMRHDYEKISHFMKTEDDILNIFSHIKINNKNSYVLGQLFEMLPSQIKDNKDFNLKLLKSNPLFYNNLNEILRADIDILEIISKNENKVGNFINKIPPQVYPHIQNESIKELIIKNNIDILEKKLWPNGWEMKKDYLLFFRDNLSRVDIKKINGYKDFIKDESLMTQLLYSDNNLFYQLPSRDKKKHAYILAALAGYGDNNSKYFLSQLPSDLWLDKQFCAKAVHCSVQSAEYISKSFFNQKDFILDFFKPINAQNIERYQKYIPKEITHYLSVFNIKDDFHQFFSRVFLSDSLNNNLVETKQSIKKHKI